MKRALIVGGSRGIGFAVAQRLVRDGLDVTIVARDAARLNEAVAALREGGGSAHGIAADATDLTELRRAFATMHARGSLDAVVYAAGTFIFKPLAEFGEDDFDRLIHANTKAPFVAFQETARRIADGGRIVFISAASTTGSSAPHSGVAVGSKAATEAIVRDLARALGPRGITANIVSPGPTESENFLRLPDDVRANAARMSPLGRVGRVGDIAAVVAFLVGDDGAWITGQNLRATGGAA